MDITLSHPVSHNFSAYYMIISGIFKVLESLRNAFTTLPLQQHCELGTEKGTGSERDQVYCLKSCKKNNLVRIHLAEKMSRWVILWTASPAYLAPGNNQENLEGKNIALTASNSKLEFLRG